MINAIYSIIAVLGALGLAIFAKRYSDLRKKEVELLKRDVEDEKAKVLDDNNASDLESLVERENKRS